MNESWAYGPGGTGGTCPPPKFLRSGKNKCKIRAKRKNFGKILICCEKIIVFHENYVMLRKIFGYVRKMFFDMSGKKFLVTSSPPARQQFWGKIWMFSLPVRANYIVPPPQRLGPYAHGTNSERGIYLLTGIYTGISTDTNTVFCWYQIFCCILLIKYCILYVYWHKYCIQTLGGDSAVCRIYNHPDRSAQVLRNLDEYLIDTTDYLRNKYPDCGNVILGDFNNFDLHNLASNHIV